MSVISFLDSVKYVKSRVYCDDDFLIRGFWDIRQVFKPSPQERELNYRYIVCQTIGSGCCYLPERESIEISNTFIGKVEMTTEN